ncbi:hypothetical protein GYMLUDRAFT_260355 [Collybiopsis luxurians FD-317 M1]|uniref:Uncharacterized protein n=1 Tax=Collybiopsis luxurians FD-317 M1 TaxID=944289 RepID=A0A0D0C237_9AGAR|nr:hypothetical protein GYMLUDRAFT_260355 [Collybiopsis luxurians FD-317 M1]
MKVFTLVRAAAALLVEASPLVQRGIPTVDTTLPHDVSYTLGLSLSYFQTPRDAARLFSIRELRSGDLSSAPTSSLADSLPANPAPSPDRPPSSLLPHPKMLCSLSTTTRTILGPSRISISPVYTVLCCFRGRTTFHWIRFKLGLATILGRCWELESCSSTWLLIFNAVSYLHTSARIPHGSSARYSRLLIHRQSLHHS